jgi:hypothetical protein
MHYTPLKDKMNREARGLVKMFSVASLKLKRKTRALDVED